MDQPFSLTSELRDNRLIIATSGYVNNVGGEAIATEFGKHFSGGVKEVVLNLEHSKVVNSIGMSFLIEMIEQLQDVDGRVIFTNLDPAVDKMLAIMGIFKFAGKATTVEEALGQLDTRS
jgi:anti-anti-sigma factor